MSWHPRPRSSAWATEVHRFTVVYDACVLYPAPLRDLLMRLALTDLYIELAGAIRFMKSGSRPFCGTVLISPGLNTFGELCGTERRTSAIAHHPEREEFNTARARVGKCSRSVTAR